MRLFTASKISRNYLLHEIKEIKAVKIYYAFKGRNAWWSTWITRYTDGCMHASLDTAKVYCEKQRTQGTVFYINELPAIAFCSDKHALIVSQINAANILNEFNFKLLYRLLKLIPFSTMSLEQITHIFKTNSSFWPESFPKNNSVFQEYCEESSELETLSKSEILLHKTSESVGNKYLLAWIDQDSKISNKTVFRLFNILRIKLSS